MILTIVVPSVHYLSQAGARIRYQRIEPALSRRDWSVEIVPIEELAALEPSAERVLLFSKVQDARGVGLAAQAAQAGAIVGVDLFDDYFSQREDVRFATQRQWLRAIAGHARFHLCSTPRMLDVAAATFPPGSGHLLNDPFASFQPKRLDGELVRKVRRMQAERTVRVLWFGMGDNPSFPVGLQDLAAFSGALRPLTASGFSATLTVLTNVRALDAAGLALLRTLPLPVTIEEWTEHREIEALSQHDVTFLPVNAQSFSVAKSLNRAVSALTGGTQILSAGYPLYAPLEPFLYRDAADLLRDVERGELRHTTRSLEALGERLATLSDPEAEAERLAAFLDAQVAQAAVPGQPSGTVAMVHGAETTAAIHRFAQRQGWLSLALPTARPGVAYDAHLGYFGPAHVPALRLTRAAAERLLWPLRSQIAAADDAFGPGAPLQLRAEALGIDLPDADVAPLLLARGPARAVFHARLRREALALFEQLFGPLCIVESEHDPLINALAAAPQPVEALA